MREIHQRSSEVHQGSSEVIRSHQRFIRGHQRSSEVISGHQRSSTQRPSERDHLNSNHLFEPLGRCEETVKCHGRRTHSTSPWAIRGDQRSSEVRQRFVRGLTHSTSPWAAASVTGAARPIQAPSAQAASGGAVGPPASQQPAFASRAALASPRASPPPRACEKEASGLPLQFEPAA